MPDITLTMSAEQWSVQKEAMALAENLKKIVKAGQDAGASAGGMEKSFTVGFKKVSQESREMLRAMDADMKKFAAQRRAVAEREERYVRPVKFNNLPAGDAEEAAFSRWVIAQRRRNDRKIQMERETAKEIEGIQEEAAKFSQERQFARGGRGDGKPPGGGGGGDGGDGGGKNSGFGVGKMASAAAGGVYAINALFDRIQGNVTANLGQFADANIAFEEQFTGLASLGDNSKHLQQIKSELIESSITFGRALPEVTQARFNFEQATSGMADNIKNDLWRNAAMLTQVKGGSLDTNITTLVKTWRNFGEGVGSVDKLSNMLAYADEQGSVKFEELADQAPEVLPAFMAAGYKLEDYLATIQVANSALGKNSKTARQTKNIPAALLNAEKTLGITFKSDDYVERLQQVATEVKKRSRDDQVRLVDELFGKQGLSLGSEVFNDVDQFAGARDKIRATRSNFMFNKFIDRRTDIPFVATEDIKRARMMSEDIPLMANKDDRAMHATLQWEMGKFGMKQANYDRPWISDAENEKTLAVQMEKHRLGGALPDVVMSGAVLTEAEMEAAAQRKFLKTGDKQVLRQESFDAFQLKLMMGEAFNLKDPTSGKYADEGSAKAFAQEWQSGYHFAPENFLQWEGLYASGKSDDARKYAQRFKDKPVEEIFRGSPNGAGVAFKGYAKGYNDKDAYAGLSDENGYLYSGKDYNDALRKSIRHEGAPGGAEVGSGEKESNPALAAAEKQNIAADKTVQAMDLLIAHLSNPTPPAPAGPPAGSPTPRSIPPKDSQHPNNM